MKKIYSFLFFLILFRCALAQENKSAINLTDMLKIKSVGNIILNVDASKAAFTVNSIIPDEANKIDYKYQNQIYVTNTTAGSKPYQLTFEKEGASQPAWSPDGTQLAFVRRVNGKGQIYVLSMSGGEAKQITTFKYGASSPVWSPDGKKILFSSGIPMTDLLKDSLLNPNHEIPKWPFEKPGFVDNNYLKVSTTKPNADGNMNEIRAYLSQDETDKKAVVLDKLNFQNEFQISSEMSLNHLFLINIDGDTAPKQITSGFNSFGNASFTPDGLKIIFSGDVDDLEHPDRSLESEIFIKDLNNGDFKMLLGGKNNRYSDASLSSTGKWLAYLSSTTSFVSINELSIMPLNGSAKDIITIPFDRNKSNLTWSKDDKYLYFTSQSNGAVPLYRLNVATKTIETLSNFESGITSFDVGKSGIIYSKTQVSNPSELYMADANMKNEKQLSSFNSWVNDKKLSFPEKKSFTNEQGMVVEYWVMKPLNYKEGEKYPLLLEIHGGPSAMWGPGETSMWQEFQYFCAKGYGIVFSNPRGSGGYGLDFLRANVNDWGTGPSKDVLTALDKTVAEGWADPNKLLITGGSYAGYLTAWIISHDQRFKAACAQRGVYDLATFFGEGNAWRLVPNYFGGYPWEPKVKEVLVRESPITYVQNIKTPFIIFHGGSDRRTGFVQGEMMFRSLKVLNRPVEYVVHPNATHEITRSGDNRQRMDQLLRTYEFFERYLSN
nr:S9 family peptidase [Pseudopedobacter sp.]